MSLSKGTARTWTDDELRQAVAANRSWSGTLRSLGLNPTSSGSKAAIRNRLAVLGISIDHFTGQRGWSDKALIQAVAESRTLGEVIRRLGLRADTGNSRSTVRAHALRLGLSLDHLSHKRPQPRFEDWMSRTDKAYLRRAAPAIAMAWFALRGVPCVLPLEPEPYDLVVELPQGFHKVQVKTTTRCVAGSYEVLIGRYRAHGPLKGECTPYDPDDVDSFFIVDGDLDVYLIPLAAVAGRGRLGLGAWRRFRQGSARGLVAGGSGVGAG